MNSYHATTKVLSRNLSGYFLKMEALKQLERVKKSMQNLQNLK